MRRPIWLIAVALGLAVALWGGIARAGVETFAQVYYGRTSDNATYSYNYQGGTGYSASASAGATGGGTPMDSTGLAPQSTSYASIGSGGTIAYATDTASLASASLSLSASGVSDFDAGQVGGTGQAIPEVGDTLNFTVAGATPTTVTDITFTMSAHGSF
jgi:hypothetical protein